MTILVSSVLHPTWPSTLAEALAKMALLKPGKPSMNQRVLLSLLAPLASRRSWTSLSQGGSLMFPASWENGKHIRLHLLRTPPLESRGRSSSPEVIIVARPKAFITAPKLLVFHPGIIGQTWHTRKRRHLGARHAGDPEASEYQI